MNTDTTTTARPSLFDRILRLEKHEYVAVAWSFVYFFCVLSAYYMLRPIRESMAVAVGVENVPWLFFRTFVAMLVAAPVFGWVASRYPRKQFLPWVYLFFIANILLFYAGFSYAVENDLSYLWLGRVFFVWVSVFNLFVVSVFWSFMADIYSHEQGRRLFGIISAGGSAGAFIGSVLTSALAEPIGFQNLLPMSAGLLAFAIFCISRLRKWVETGRRDDVTTTTVASNKPLGGRALGGLRQIGASKYLSSITAVSVIASLLGTALYMFMLQMVGDAVEGTDSRTQFFGYINQATTALAFLSQLFLVNRTVRRFGVGATLAILPVVSLVGFAILAINPAIMVVAVLQAVRRGIGFGFGKPTHDMLYSVVTPKEKYKAKNFIETFVYRGGDFIGSFTVLLVWAAGFSVISLLMLPFAVIWAAFAIWLGRDYVRRDKLGIGGD